MKGKGRKGFTRKGKGKGKGKGNWGKCFFAMKLDIFPRIVKFRGPGKREKQNAKNAIGLDIRHQNVK